MKTPLETLQDFLKNDKVIPVIGAGVSSATANLPGWSATIENGLEFAELHRLDSDLIHQARSELAKGDVVGGANTMKSLLNAPRQPFSNWLKTLFGAPVVRSPDLLNSIEDLCAPIVLTTNYDKLLTARSRMRTMETFDWSDYQEAHGALLNNPRFILHLHGVWSKPETVILSKTDYVELNKVLGYKELLKTLWSSYHFLFIGCSKNGVMDDDFSTVFEFLNTWFPGNSHQHFILLSERDIVAKAHLPLLAKCNIAPISYGHDYAKLADFINAFNPNRDRARLEAVELKKEINDRVGRLNLSDAKYSVSDADTRKLILDTLPSGAYWIDSVHLKLLENALKEANNKIQTKREQFRFSQSVVKALFTAGELETQLRFWAENSEHPSILNNTRFINLAILCYECLQRMPADLMEEIRHRDPYAIHSYYFTGYLGEFIKEYRHFRDMEGHTYDNDKYLFENLKRIISSLRGVLNINADVLFPVAAPAAIALRLEAAGFLFVCESECSLRKPVFPYERIAWLPTQDNLPFRDAVAVRFRGELIVVAFNSRVCIKWNPTKEISPASFFEAPRNQTISRMFITEATVGQVVLSLYCGSMIYTFENFEKTREFRVKTWFEELVYHRERDCFFGFNSLNNLDSSPVLSRVSWDGECEPLVYSDAIWGAIQTLPLFTTVDVDLNQSFLPRLNGGSMGLRRWGERDVIVVRLKTIRSGAEATVLTFIDVEKLNVNFLAHVVFPKKLCIAFDLMRRGKSVDLTCGFLATGHYPKNLVQWTQGINNRMLTQVEEEFSFIETGRDPDFDIHDVWHHSGGRVFVNQRGTGTLYDLLLSDGCFEKISIHGLLKIVQLE